MRFGTSGEYNWAATLLIAACATSVGCKSGWKMPGASLLNWNRQPSAETLAGTLTTPQLPDSPASKYAPSAIASAAAGTKPTSTSGVASATPTSTSSPYSTVSTPVKSAASANGYQVGPYSTSASPYGGNTATNSSLSTNIGALAVPSSTPNKSANPYGGTYAGAAGIGGYGQSSAYSASGLASSGPSAPAANPAYNTPSPYSIPNATGLSGGTSGALTGTNTPPSTTPLPGYAPPSTSGGSTTGFSMPNLAASGISSMPNHIPQSVSVGGHVNGGSTSPAAYPLTTGSLNPSTPASANYTQVPSSPVSANQVSTATGLPTMPAYSAAPTQNGSAYAGSSSVSPSSYRPGTTGRSTNYNFGSPEGSGQTAASPYSTTPSQSTPRPASATYPNYGGINYGGPGSGTPNYGGSAQLPSNTASGGGPGMTPAVQPSTIYR